MFKSILFAGLLTSQAHAAVDIHTYFRDVSGVAKTRISIQCNSQVMIHNETNQENQYLVGTQVCAQNNDCADNNGWVTVKPGETFKNQYQTVELAVFNRPGTKDLSCTNYVAGAEKKVEKLTAHAYIS